jgi:hypothetical protein
VVFTFPDETRWLERPVVQVYLHDEQWRVWGLALFSLVQS